MLRLQLGIYFFAFCTLIMAENSFVRFEPEAYQSAATTTADSIWQNPAAGAFINAHEVEMGYNYFGGKQKKWNQLTFSSAFNFTQTVGIGLGLQSRNNLFFKDVAKADNMVSGVANMFFRTSGKSGVGLNVVRAFEKNTDFLFSFGVLSRPTSWISLTGYYQEVHNGYFNAPNLILGTAFRPFKELLTLGFDSKWLPRSNNWSSGFTYVPAINALLQKSGYDFALGLEFPRLAQKDFSPLISASLGINFSTFGTNFKGSYDSKSQSYGTGAKFRLSTQKWPSVVKEEKYWVLLDIDSDGEIYSHKEAQPLERFVSSNQDYLINRALIKSLSEKEEVLGVIFKFRGFNFSEASADEWRDILLSFKKQGKKVVVYLDRPSELDLYFSSVADQLLMSPNQTLEFAGFRANLTYFGDTLKKFGIAAEATASSDYKTAPRKFTNNRPKKEEIEVTKGILKSYYDTTTKEISLSRNLPLDKVKSLFDQGELTADDCLKEKLVDELVNIEDVEDFVLDMFGKQHQIFAFDGLLPKKNVAWNPPKKIAIIPVHGEIVYGHVKPNLFSMFGDAKVGSLDFCEEIERASLDPEISGILLHIDSGGGNAEASDDMYRAVVAAKEIKPVVASMGEVAASGGYAVAIGSDVIFANKQTITGSIGVFTLKFNAQKLLEKKLKVFNEELSVVKNPGGSIFRPDTLSEKKISKRTVDWYYDNFIARVAENRQLSTEDVRKYAQGRVWLGKEALERSLITHQGGFTDALDKLKSMMSVTQQDEILLTVYYPHKTSFLSAGNLFFAAQNLFGSHELASIFSTRKTISMKAF